MVVRSIGSVVNTGFVARVSSSSPSSTTAEAIKSFPSSVSDVRSSLRIGARRIADSVTQVNGVISALSISQENLETLEKIVDKVIKIAEKAERSGLSSQERQQLNQDFRRLGRKFTKIIEDSSDEEIDLLTSDGVKTALTSIGLAPEAVDEIEDLFRKLVIFSKSETRLADERSKGPRPLRGRPSGDGVDTVIPGGVESTVSTAPNFDLLSNETNVATNPDTSLFSPADYDGDGDLDLLSTSQTGSYASYIQNNGDGTYAASVSLATAAASSFNVSGDFNGDGNEDFLAAHTAAGNVGIYLGNGNGTFAAGVCAGNTTSASFISVADFDGDGNLDYSAVSGGANTASVFLGNGDGTFANSATITTVGGDALIASAVGDFNNDGEKDIALATSNRNYNLVYYGNGNGTFALGASIASSTAVTASTTAYIVAGDLNGDGIDDLASSAKSDGVINVNFSNGDGTFRPRVTYAVTGGNTHSVQIGDIDGDGITDLAYTTTAAGTPHLGVLKGHGSGAFRAPVTIAATGDSALSQIADLNGDGRNDLIFKDYSSSSLRILQSNRVTSTIRVPEYTYTAPNLSLLNSETNLTTSDEILSYAVADFDGDGDNDLFGIDRGSGNGYFIRSNGNGTFGPPQTRTGAIGGTIPVAGDFNLDGKADLFITNSTSNYSAVALGNGDGTFQAEITSVALPGAGNVSAGDFDGDGKTDLVAVAYNDNYVQVYRGNGDGTFANGGTITLGVGDLSIDVKIGDFNDDGKKDFVVVSQNRNYLSVYNGNGDGTFAVGASLAASVSSAVTSLRSIAVGDINGDGADDIAVTADTDGVVSVLVSNGDGTFQARVSYAATGGATTTVILDDIDGDGEADLTYTTRSGGGNPHLGIRLGNGNGTFGAATTIAASGESYALVAGDFTGDGRNDIILQDYNISQARILKSNRVATPVGPVTYGYSYTSPNLNLLNIENLNKVATPGSLSNHLIADFDGDGDNDLITERSDAAEYYYIENRGDGTFSAAISRSSPAISVDLQTGDFNGDGHNDLLSTVIGVNAVGFRAGNGDGTFAGMTSAGGLADVNNIVVNDFNGDGNLDFAGTAYTHNYAGVFFGNGDGTFSYAGGITSGGGDSYTDLTTGDFNNDGDADIAIAVDNQTYNLVYYGNGSGSFSLGASLASTSSSGTNEVNAADVNGDGIDDIVSSGLEGYLNVHIANGDGSFQNRVSYSVPGTNPFALETVDINGDGDVDLSYKNQTGGVNLGILLGNGDGTFGTPTTISVSGAGYLSSGDVNGDGRNDLVAGFSGVTNIFASDRLVSTTITPVDTTVSGEEYNGPLRDTANIFNSGRTLLSRNESIVVLTDVKALKKQIEKNISIIEKTKEEIGKALDLLRATGFGFLDVSNSLSSASSADSVAATVRKAIFARGGRGSDAAGLLDPIISASLLSDASRS